MGCTGRGERQIGHAGLGIDLQQHHPTPVLIIAEIRAADAPAAERPVGAERHVPGAGRDVWRKGGRDDEIGVGIGAVLGGVVVETGLGHDLDHRQGAVAEDGDGDLAPRDVLLGHEGQRRRLHRPRSTPRSPA